LPSARRAGAGGVDCRRKAPKRVCFSAFKPVWMRLGMVREIPSGIYRIVEKYFYMSVLSGMDKERKLA
jgi:hypothetical protein